MGSLKQFWDKNNNDKIISDARTYLNSGGYEGGIWRAVQPAQQCTTNSQCASGFKCSGGRCVEDRAYGSGIVNGQGCGGGGGGGGGDNPCGATEKIILYGDPDFVDFYTDLLGSTPYGFVASGFTRDRLDLVTIRDKATGQCLYEGCGGFGGIPGPDGQCCDGSTASTNSGTAQCPPPPPGDCSRFCDNALKATGEPPAGCSDGNTCSRCEFCSSSQNKCVPLGSDAPCYCDSASGCGACERCSEEGDCVDDCASCQTCTIMLNHTCPCGTVGSFKCCVSACNAFSPSLADCALAGCAKVDDCPPGGDPCAGDCVTITTYDGDPVPPCPPGKVCRTSGTISVGGGTATLTEQCDYSGLSDDCFPCDCNCDSDCGDCEICNAAGVCVPDPLCQCTAIQTYTVNITRNSYTIANPKCSRPNGCGDIYTNPSASWTVRLNAKGPLSISYEDSGPVYRQGSCGYTEYIMGSRLITIKDCEGKITYQTTLSGPT